MVNIHKQSIELFNKLMRDEITQEEFQEKTRALMVVKKKLPEYDWTGEEG